ncbi:siderophore-interacting protein [Kocuria massiliensis]|uniref:siderophore-interacting protein n=1 Tax=Kocuria massiliensis TaxID=1926282 RepID=UPI000A1CE2FD|nr:siderophore-interacting protein [Kocuria massiliensis]
MSAIPMELFEARVTGKERLSRDFVRVRLASEQLTRLASPAGNGEPQVLDAYLKLFIPHPDLEGPVRVELNETWRQKWFAAEPHERGGWIRTYTLRDARPWISPEGREGVEIDIDFVLHEPEGSCEDETMGPGASWADNAQVGDPLTFIGPSREGQLWTMWNPSKASNVVACADETAIPAALSVLRFLPEGSHSIFLMELPSGNESLIESAKPLIEAASKHSEVEVHWLQRDDGVQRGKLTLQALREAFGLDPKEEDADSPLGVRLPADEFVWGTSEQPGETYVYLAGEASVVRASRRVCVNEAGVDKASISFMGYWKAGHAES